MMKCAAWQQASDPEMHHAVLVGCSMLGLQGLELHAADVCRHGADHVIAGAAQVLDPGQHGNHGAEHVHA
eukprot:2257865-Alexandrium_andersonii.AAC.2